MNRRGFLGGFFGTAVAATALTGKAVAGDSFKQSRLLDEEAAMLAELKEKRMIMIPSRKSIMFTEELRKKRDILKRLVHKNQVCIDFHIARPDDEADESCMAYYLPSEGKTPLDYYAS